MGFISSGRFPYEFETAAFTTPEGEISEVVESPAGYHIVKAGRHRTSRGKVEAAHIMKLLPKGASEAEKARAKHQIDSLYALVKADPSRFGEIAKSNSDDKGSARQNGKLPIFGSGEMVPEFEAAAFALKDGEISEPVKSMYGWHIIRKILQHSAQTEQELKPEILRRISSPQDGRYRLVKEHRTSNLAAKHQASLNSEAIGEIMSKAGENGIDSLFVASYIAGPLSSVTVAQIDGVSIPASEMFSNMKKLRQSDPGTASEVIKDVADNFFARKLVEAEEDWLYDNNAEYRNLLNEYRDGSLLYEVSVQKVWDKAAKDEAGLQRYFENHKGDYTWTEPRVKGVLVQTVNDSLANVIKTRMNELPADSLVQNIRKEFPGKVQIDKVLATKGTNAIVDNLVFGGPEVKPSNSNFTSYFMFEPRMLDNPEEAGDVRGQVTSDYQTELESLWIEDLKKAYPVKVNKKELKKVK
ncbi:MAG: peptidyl-prolyl cis-trans isomerase [Muribaculaceae bacterium]